MSIAEKLTTIAENEQRVYEAGVQKGIVSAIPTIYEETNPQWIGSEYLFDVTSGVYLDIGEIALYKGLKIRAEIYNEEEVVGGYGIEPRLRIEDGAADEMNDLCVCNSILNYNAEKKRYETETTIKNTPKNGQVKIGIWTDAIPTEHSPFGNIRIYTDDPDYAEYFYKRAEWSRFWNAYQQNGNRTNYKQAFYDRGWTDENYRPKYKIVAVGEFNSAYRESKMTSLSNLDTSGATNFNTTFYNTDLITIDKLDLSNATTLTSTFAHSSDLHTIGELVSSENTVWASNTFDNCTALVNLTFSENSVIATNFNCAKATALSHDSLMSIVNALKDYSPEKDVYTCTLGSTNLANLSTEEKAVATQKGWTLA